MNDRLVLLIMSAAGGAITAISIVVILWGWFGLNADATIIKIFAAILGAGASFGYLSRRVKRKIERGGG